MVRCSVSRVVCVPATPEKSSLRTPVRDVLFLALPCLIKDCVIVSCWAYFFHLSRVATVDNQAPIKIPRRRLHSIQGTPFTLHPPLLN